MIVRPVHSNNADGQGLKSAAYNSRAYTANDSWNNRMQMLQMKLGAPCPQYGNKPPLPRKAGHQQAREDVDDATAAASILTALAAGVAFPPFGNKRWHQNNENAEDSSLVSKKLRTKDVPSSSAGILGVRNVDTSAVYPMMSHDDVINFRDQGNHLSLPPPLHGGAWTGHPDPSDDPHHSHAADPPPNEPQAGAHRTGSGSLARKRSSSGDVNYMMMMMQPHVPAPADTSIKASYSSGTPLSPGPAKESPTKRRRTSSSCGSEPRSGSEFPSQAAPGSSEPRSGSGRPTSGRSSQPHQPAYHQGPAGASLLDTQLLPDQAHVQGPADPPPSRPAPHRLDRHQETLSEDNQDLGEQAATKMREVKEELEPEPARPVSHQAPAQQRNRGGGSGSQPTAPGPESGGRSPRSACAAASADHGNSGSSSQARKKSGLIVATVHGATREAAAARATPGPCVSGVPVYRGYHPQWKNTCANCDGSTSAVWRKGWPIGGSSGDLANLCNACGLRYAAGAVLERDPRGPGRGTSRAARTSSEGSAEAAAAAAAGGNQQQPAAADGEAAGRSDPPARQQHHHHHPHPQQQRSARRQSQVQSQQQHTQQQRASAVHSSRQRAVVGGSAEARAGAPHMRAAASAQAAEAAAAEAVMKEEPCMELAGAAAANGMDHDAAAPNAVVPADLLNSHRRAVELVEKHMRENPHDPANGQMLMQMLNNQRLLYEGLAGATGHHMGHAAGGMAAGHGMPHMPHMAYGHPGSVHFAHVPGRMAHHHHQGAIRYRAAPPQLAMAPSAYVLHDMSSEPSGRMGRPCNPGALMLTGSADQACRPEGGAPMMRLCDEGGDHPGSMAIVLAGMQRGLPCLSE